MDKNTTIFDGCLGITPEGKDVRASVVVDDLVLCQVNEESEKINKYLADTMAFIAGFDSPDK